MIGDPLPVCLMLTSDRPQFAARAIRSFAKQTNRRSVLFVLDSGERPLFEWCSMQGARRWGYAGIGRVVCAEYHPEMHGWPICKLMNTITEMAVNNFGSTPKVFFKWDDDDWSHRERIREQLGMLKLEAHREVVGYNSMPLAQHVVCKFCNGHRINRLACFSCRKRGFYCSQVFEYLNASNNYALGTSLAYTDTAWKQYKFPNAVSKQRPRGTGSDTAFVHHWAALGQLHAINSQRTDAQMMVASIHSDNASMLTLDPKWPRSKEGREREIRVLMEETE